MSALAWLYRPLLHPLIRPSVHVDIFVFFGFVMQQRTNENKCLLFMFLSNQSRTG